MTGGGGVDHKRCGKCTSQQPIPKGPVRLGLGGSRRVEGGRLSQVCCSFRAASIPFQPPLLPAKGKTPLQD